MGRYEDALKIIDQAIATYPRDLSARLLRAYIARRAAIKFLLRDDPVYAERAQAFSASLRDISELLAELEPVAPRHPIPLRVAYHDACHLAAP